MCVVWELPSFWTSCHIMSSRFLDFINVMTYDFHGAWDPMTAHNSPLYQGAADQGDNIYFNIVSETRRRSMRSRHSDL